MRISRTRDAARFAVRLACIRRAGAVPGITLKMRKRRACHNGVHIKSAGKIYVRKPRLLPVFKRFI